MNELFRTKIGYFERSPLYACPQIEESEPRLVNPHNEIKPLMKTPLNNSSPPFFIMPTSHFGLYFLEPTYFKVDSFSPNPNSINPHFNPGEQRNHFTVGNDILENAQQDILILVNTPFLPLLGQSIVEQCKKFADGHDFVSYLPESLRKIQPIDDVHSFLLKPLIFTKINPSEKL